MATAKVLIVDDDPVLLYAFTEILNLSGYEAIPAAGPRQALKIIRNQPTIDVVLSDVVMPEMRGTELVREVAVLSPTTACVLMSGSVIAPAELPPDVPLLGKPVYEGDLLAAVDKAIERGLQNRAKLQATIKEAEELRAKAECLVAETQEAIRQSLQAQARLNSTKEKPEP